MQLDHTHDPDAICFVDSAQEPNSDFPMQNLPWCRFRRDGEIHIGTAIGTQLVDLTAAYRLGLVTPNLNDGTLVALSEQSARLRQQVFEGLGPDSSWRDHSALLLEREGVDFLLPFEVGDYTDFYASVHHATRVGSMFRPDNPLLPNYKWVPIGYHGRASSLVVSGTPISRPSGQLKGDDAEAPTFGPCKLLDYELEVGFWIGQGNVSGQPLPIAQAQRHILGIGLVNDWSARDIQKWEYQPLGPFLAKSFATSVSPFVVTREALAPFRCAVPARPQGDPRPLPYLWNDEDQDSGLWNLQLEVRFSSAAMREQGLPEVSLSRSQLRDLYWSPAQMVAHHTSNGCNLRCGDLLASGTVSGPEANSAGCLLELTWRGPGQPRQPLTLPTGETRTFLQSGDEVNLRGSCAAPGRRSLGLGECRGRIL